jgi:LysR family transcriptional regulator (chromosome initiation inhibitor)
MSLLSPPLEAFLAVVERGKVHAAAHDLGLTQTAVTQRIRALETSLATTLFTRSRQGMALTREGEALLRYCQGVRELEGQALASIEQGGKVSSARVVITGPSSLLRARIVPAVAPVLREFPELAITFLIEDREEWAELIRTGKAQMALMPPEYVAREMDSRLIAPERYLLVGPLSWRGRALDKIVEQERIIDFDATDRMTKLYLRQIRLESKARGERHFVNSTELVASLIEQGIGYGVLTEEMAKPYLDSQRLIDLNPGKRLNWRHAVAWFPRPQMPPYFAALLKAIT